MDDFPVTRLPAPTPLVFLRDSINGIDLTLHWAGRKGLTSYSHAHLLHAAQLLENELALIVALDSPPLIA